MKRIIVRVLMIIGALLFVAAVGGGGFAFSQARAFDASLERVYEVPVPNVTRSSDPAVVARGEHLARSVMPCAIKECHGADLGGGTTIDMGPLGKLNGPNIGTGGLGVAYTDGELARLLRDGVKKDGRTIRFMPVQDSNWMSDDDIAAIVSWMRTVPPVDRPNQPTSIGLLGKVLDRREGGVILDVARRIDHGHVELAPPPAPVADYGRFIARLCTGCHGEHLGGGRIPGAPSTIPIPLDITPDATGLRDWTFDDFEKLMRTAVRKSGKPLDPFMPVDAWSNFDDVELHALWAYLRTVPPVPFGGR
jgi:hypothetical protein